MGDKRCKDMGDSFPPYWTPGKGVQHALGGPARVRTPSRLRPPSRHAPSADPAGLLRLPHQWPDATTFLSGGCHNLPIVDIGTTTCLERSDDHPPWCSCEPTAH